MKPLGSSRTVVAIVVVIVLTCGLWYWSMTQMLSFPWVWEEELRVPSPSGSLEIVIFEGNRGAMSSFRYAYVLAKRGETADPGADDGQGLVLVCRRSGPPPYWIDDGTLVIPNGSHAFYSEPRPAGFDVVAEISREADE